MINQGTIISLKNLFMFVEVEEFVSVKMMDANLICFFSIASVFYGLWQHEQNQVGITDKIISRA